MKTCNSCAHCIAGGCVHPMSSVGFDDLPDQACDLWHERLTNIGKSKFEAAVAAQRPPTSRETTDRAQLSNLLGGIQKEHAPRVWDARMAASEGRR